MTAVTTPWWHLHRFRVVKHAAFGNAYLRCRCGKRKIRQPCRNSPMDYSWIERGTFAVMPTRGPVGPGGAGRANR